MLGDDEFGFVHVLRRGIGFIHGLSINEGHHVGVLLQGSAFTKMRKLGFAFAPAFLRRAVELGEGEDGKI